MNSEAAVLGAALVALLRSARGALRLADRANVSRKTVVEVKRNLDAEILSFTERERTLPMESWCRPRSYS